MSGFERIAWPTSCIACGTTDLEGSMSFRHVFKTQREEKVLLGKKIHTTTAGASLHMCQSCLQKEEGLSHKDVITAVR